VLIITNNYSRICNEKNMTTIREVADNKIE